jgi:hypothetical protein
VGNKELNRKGEHLRREGGYVGEGRKFGHEAHPSVTQENTYTDNEMRSSEFRERVARFKTEVLRASLELNEDTGVFWQAIHEVAWEFLIADKGEAHATQYLKALQVYEEWAFKKGLAPRPSPGDQ